MGGFYEFYPFIVFYHCLCAAVHNILLYHVFSLCYMYRYVFGKTSLKPYLQHGSIFCYKTFDSGSGSGGNVNLLTILFDWTLTWQTQINYDIRFHIFNYFAAEISITPFKIIICIYQRIIRFKRPYFLYNMYDKTSLSLTHWGWDKWTPFHRRHFQMHFLEWKCLNSDYNFTEVCSQGFN